MAVLLSCSEAKRRREVSATEGKMKEKRRYAKGRVPNNEMRGRRMKHSNRTTTGTVQEGGMTVDCGCQSVRTVVPFCAVFCFWSCCCVPLYHSCVRERTVGCWVSGVGTTRPPLFSHENDLTKNESYPHIYSIVPIPIPSFTHVFFFFHRMAPNSVATRPVVTADAREPRAIMVTPTRKFFC